MEKMISEWKKQTAAELMEKLEEGFLSGEKEGCFTEEEVDRHFAEKLRKAQQNDEMCK